MTDVKRLFDEVIEPPYPQEGLKSWAYEKTLRQIIDEIDREDWLLWILSKVLGVKSPIFIKIKAECANVIANIIKNTDVLYAIEISIKYGNGECTEQEYENAIEKAAAAQKQISNNAYIHTELQGFDDCIQSMISRWIYDNEGYSMYRSAVELHSDLYKSIPFFEYKQQILTTIRQNTNHLN